MLQYRLAGIVTFVKTAGRREWFALVTLMLPVFLIAVDNTVLSFAVPAISIALATSGTELLWIIDVYPLVLAALLVPMGSLGDRIGRRRLLLIGGAGFAIVSVLAAFAPTGELLILARALLGIFGAMLMPATLSLIRNIFTDARERRTAIAIWATGFSGGAALGPIVGGLLLEHFWWGSVFMLSVPVLIPLLVFGPMFIPESRDPNPGPIDVWSIVLVMLTMAPLVFGIKAITIDGFTLAAAAPIVVGVLFGMLFVQRQLVRTVPMLDVRLFRNAVFSGSLVANLLSVFSLMGFIFFLAQYLQLVAGQSPIEAGISMLPGAVVTVLAGLTAARMVRRIRPALVIAGGLLSSAGGYAVVFLADHEGSVVGLMVAFALLGLGAGAAETLSNDLILSSAPAAKSGAASAISETAYEVGAVLGTAVLGGIVTAGYQRSIVLPDGLRGADLARAGETLGGAVDVAASLPTGQSDSLMAAASAAFDSGVAFTSMTGLILMVVSAGIVLVTLRSVKADGRPVPSDQPIPVGGQRRP